MLEEGFSITEIAEHFGVTRGAIQYLQNPERHRQYYLAAKINDPEGLRQYWRAADAKFRERYGLRRRGALP